MFSYAGPSVHIVQFTAFLKTMFAIFYPEKLRKKPEISEFDR